MVRVLRDFKNTLLNDEQYFQLKHYRVYIDLKYLLFSGINIDIFKRICKIIPDFTSYVESDLTKFSSFIFVFDSSEIFISDSKIPQVFFYARAKLLFTLFALMLTFNIF